MRFNGMVKITGCQPLLEPGSRIQSDSIENRGFVLLELLLALAVTGILVGGLMAVYWMSSSACRIGSSRALLQFTLREARNCMLKDIWASDSIQVLDARYGSTVAPGVVGNCVKIIVGTVKDINTEYTGIYYYVQNGCLYRERQQLNNKENDGDDTLVDKIAITDNMTSAAFSCPVNGRLDYSLTGQLNSHTCTVNGVGRSRVDCSMNPRR